MSRPCRPSAAGPSALAVLVWIGLACGPANEREPASLRAPGSEGPLVVYSVNEPLRYFAERIGGDEVTAVFPAPASVDPALWSPAPEVVVAYQDADLVLLNGGGYAQWTTRVTLSRRRLVDASAAFADRLISRQDSVTHGHGPSGTHSHAETAGNVWLDPALALAQALAVKQAFVSARPAESARFEAAYLALEEDLRALDERLARAAAPLRDVGLAFSHPVYAYLERRYGLRGPSLHWEPNEMPDEAQWRELESLLAQQPVQLMLWEAAPLPEVARRLGARGVHVVVYEPAANSAERGDWLDVMRRNVGNLEDVVLPPGLTP